MSTLDISPQKEKLFDELEIVAGQQILKYLKGERGGGDDIRVAQGTLSNIAKNRQTMTARDALKFNMASIITDDPKKLKKYVESTQPEIKRLMGTKEEKD